MHIELKTFQQQLLNLFTSQSERENFLRSSGTEYATYKNIEALPKKAIEVYAGLLSNTADGTMSSVFPAVRTLYNDAQWLSLLENYFATCKQSHYRLNAIAQNFSQFLATQSKNSWLAEISDYEYQELVAEENEAEIPEFSYTPLISQTEIISLSPILNPTFCLRTYTFDVVKTTMAMLAEEEISIPPSPEKTKIVFFRDPQTHRCRQLNIGDTAESIISIIVTAASGQLTYAQILQKSLSENQSNSKQTSIEDRIAEMLEIFSDFHAVNLFTGNLMSA